MVRNPPLVSSEERLDPFAELLAETDRHRRQHGCWAYPFRDGPGLGTLAAATRATRVLELGTALGYTACWFAHANPASHVETVERDLEHVVLARRNIERFGFADRVNVIEADFDEALAPVEPGYDLAFFDGYAPTGDQLNALRGLLRPRGVLVSANLNLVETSSVREMLDDTSRWLTASMLEGGRTFVSVAV